MMFKHGRWGFTLAELLVVIAIIGILAGFLLPVVGKARHAAKIAMAESTLSNLSTALADYYRDNGVFPPDNVDKSINGLDKPSETLYFFLSGSDIDSPNPGIRQRLEDQRSHVPVYFDFKLKYLDDYDSDNNYEIVDPWGNPWIYVKGMYPGKPGTFVIGNPETKKPWHHKSKYDLYSVGPDGKTGNKPWKDDSRIFYYQPSSSKGFYGQASDEYEDGTQSDDIKNF